MIIFCGYSLNLGCKPEIQSILLNILFIHKEIGLAQNASWNGASWFVCCLFFCSILYYSFAKIIGNRLKFNIYTFLICLLTLSLLTTNRGVHDTIYFNILNYNIGVKIWAYLIILEV